MGFFCFFLTNLSLMTDPTTHTAIFKRERTKTWTYFPLPCFDWLLEHTAQSPKPPRGERQTLATFLFLFFLLFSMLSLSLNRIVSVFQTSFLSLSIFPLVPVCSLLTGDSVGVQTKVHSPTTGLPDEHRPSEHAQLLYIEHPRIEWILLVSML